MQFQHTQQISRVVLVGCGGTGSQWASAIARILYDMGERGQHVPKLRLVDPDRVELKNVGRQGFTVGEVGRFKADVLARRFSLSLGIQVEWFAESFNANKHIGHADLICGAVDNHEARKELAQTGCIWIDAGNHRSAGQVVIGNASQFDRVADHFDKKVFDYLPYATTLFPSLLEPDPAQETQNLSCAELVALGEQHLLINSLMAAVAAQYTYKILNGEPVETFISYVNSDPLVVRSIPITPEDMQPYFPKRRLL